MVSSRTLRVNDDLPMVDDDKRTLAWFYSDRLELLFGIERVRVRVFLYFTTFTSHSFLILFLTDQMKGFVSTFQLLGRFVRRISVVFHRNFTRRDNQHVRFSPGGGDSYMKQTGMLVVSLRGVNFGFWSRLGCSGQSANILSRQGLA